MSDHKCTSCGADIEYSAGVKQLKCPYCGAVNAIERPEDRLPDDIEKIVPLAVTLSDLEQRVYAYMAKGHYTPDDMLEAAVFTKKERLYVPAFLFKVEYEARWTASFGYDRTEHYTDFVTVNGRQQARSRTKTVTDWRPQNGIDGGVFSLPAYAGRMLDETSLQPSELVSGIIAKGELTSFNPSFMKGVETEAFTTPEPAAWNSVKDDVDSLIDRKVKSHAQGDRQKDWHWTATMNHYASTLYVPFCHAVFDYKGQEYHVWLDGVDGEDFRADALPVDGDRKKLVTKGFFPAGAGLAGLIGSSMIWSFSGASLFLLAVAAGYGALRRHALLGYSKKIRDSLLTQMHASSSSQALTPEEESKLARAFQRPEKPLLARTHLDKKLIPGLSLATLLAVAIPSYMTHSKFAVDSAPEPMIEESMAAAPAPEAAAAPVDQGQVMTFEGTLATGPEVSGLLTDPNDSASATLTFANNSELAATVLNFCVAGQRCSVTGNVRKNELVVITDVHSMEAAQPATDAAAASVQPSFDCSNASTSVEHLICSNGELASLDVRMAEAFQTAVANTNDPGALRAMQRAWRKDRDTCPDVDCIENSYNVRLTMLAGDNTF